MSGIYLHIPFCETKCIYCDFYSVTNHTGKNEFIQALLKEIEHYSSLLSDYKFKSVFFGGGTPSILRKKDYDLIFNSLFKHYSINESSEITIEANPGTLNNQKLAEFKSLPVNRLSFGVQSFNNDDLNFLTRIHNSEEAVKSVLSAQDAGFNNINIDLIYALPNQTLFKWKDNIEKAVSLNTQHISAYALIFEDNTKLFNLRKNGDVNCIDAETERDMFDLTSTFLKSHGFEHYEISNFAKPGYECKHNLVYWQREEYIAFGPSASSFIGNNRWTNVRNLNKYTENIKLKGAALDFLEEIDKDTAITEYIFLGLRSKGIELNKYRDVFHIDFTSTYSSSVIMLVNNGFAEVNNNLFKLTPKGYAYCDEIVAKYF